jgi:hypothetical protein
LQRRIPSNIVDGKTKTDLMVGIIKNTNPPCSQILTTIPDHK